VSPKVLSIEAPSCEGALHDTTYRILWRGRPDLSVGTVRAVARAVPEVLSLHLVLPDQRDAVSRD
jgi:hypothetical protein